MLYYNTYYIYKTKKLMFLPLTVYRISITLFPNEVNLNMNKHNHHNNIYHNEKLRTFCSTSSLESSWTTSECCYYNLEMVSLGGSSESLTCESRFKASLQSLQNPMLVEHKSQCVTAWQEQSCISCASLVSHVHKLHFTFYHATSTVFGDSWK